MLLGRPPTQDLSESAHGPESLLADAAHHGLGPLLHQAQQPHLPGLRNRVQKRLHDGLAQLARQEAVAEVFRERNTRQVLDALGDSGLCPLVLKGTALAYGYYPRPDLRPRVDLDLFLPEEDIEEASRILVLLDYQLQLNNAGTLISRQVGFATRRRDAPRQVIDLHWQISNRPRFAQTLSYREMSSRAQPLAKLGPRARAPHPEDLLLHACFHYAGHHLGERRLIWLYDIHLLLTMLSTTRRDHWLRRVRDKEMQSVCGPVLTEYRRLFRDPGNTGELAGWLDEACKGYREPPVPSPIRRITEDLKALPDWGNRFKLLQQHAFPSADYMRLRYGIQSPWRLPLAYLTRGVRGIGKWLRAGSLRRP